MPANANPRLDGLDEKGTLASIVGEADTEETFISTNYRGFPSCLLWYNGRIKYIA